MRDVDHLERLGDVEEEHSLVPVPFFRFLQIAPPLHYYRDGGMDCCSPVCCEFQHCADRRRMIVEAVDRLVALVPTKPPIG
jgi:hypothetical protein